MSFDWAEVKGIQVYSVDSQIYQGDEYIVFVGEDTGYVYLMESGNNFDGTDIDAQYWTPYLSITDPTIRKTLYKIWAYYDPEGSIVGDLTLNYDFNRSTKIQPDTITFTQSGGGVLYGTAIFGTGTYAGETQDAVLETNLLGSGQTVQLRFDFSGSEPFIIDTILLEYAQEDRK